MSKSRRDKFEDQLRALQSDINHLSHKLSVPAAHPLSAHSASETPMVHQKKSSKGDIVAQSKNSSSVKHHERSVPASTIKTIDVSDIGQRYPTTMDELSNQSSWKQIIDQSRGAADGRSNQNNEFNQISTGSNHSIATGQQLRDKGGLQEESSDTYSLIRERNKLLNRLEQSQNQIEELRRVVVENREIQAQYDRLTQDHLLVKISLESSERIRRQQKELINLLQHSAAVAEGTHTLGRNAALSPSSISTAAENRNWLNGFNSTDSIGSKNIDYSNHVDLDDRFANNVSSKNEINELNMMNFEEPEPIGRISKSATRKAKTPSNTIKVRKGSGSSSGNSERNGNNNNNYNYTTNTNNGKSYNTGHRTNSLGNSGSKRNPPSRTVIDKQSQSARPLSINRGHTEAGMSRRKHHNIPTPTRFDEQMASSLSSLGLTMRVEDMDVHDNKTELLSDSMPPAYHNSVQKDFSNKLTNTRITRRQSAPQSTPSSPISLPSRSREGSFSTNRDMNRGRAHSADARGAYHNGIASMSSSHSHNMHAERGGSTNGIRYVGESGLKRKQSREGDSGLEADLAEYHAYANSPNNIENRTTGRPPIPKYNQPSHNSNQLPSRSGGPGPRQNQNQSYSAVKAIRMRSPTFSSTQNLTFSSSAYTRALD